MIRIRRQFMAALCTSLMIVTPMMTPGCVPTAAESDDNGLTVYTLSDISSGLIGGIDFGTGDNLYLFGDKSSDGLVTNLEAIAMLDANQTLYEIHFDENGLPIQIRENGQVWDIAYDDSNPGNIQRGTITHNGQSSEFELLPEFNELLQSALNGSVADPTARRANWSTLLGTISVGIGIAGIAVISAAAAPIAVAGTITGGVAAGVTVGVIGMVATVAGGCATIAQSLSDRPPNEIETKMNNALAIVSIATSTPSFIIAQGKFIQNVSLTAAERIDNLSLLATVAGIEQSPILQDVNAARDTACPPQNKCNVESGGGNTGGSCSTVAYATYTYSETIRVVTAGVDTTLGLLGTTDRLQVCEAPTVQVYDSSGSFAGSITVPWSALNVSLIETPIVFITYQAENGLFARVEYTTLLPIALETSNQ